MDSQHNGRNHHLNDRCCCSAWAEWVCGWMGVCKSIYTAPYALSGCTYLPGLTGQELKNSRKVFEIKRLEIAGFKQLLKCWLCLASGLIDGCLFQQSFLFPSLPEYGEKINSTLFPEFIDQCVMYTPTNFTRNVLTKKSQYRWRCLHTCIQDILIVLLNHSNYCNFICTLPSGLVSCWASAVMETKTILDTVHLA